MKPIESSKQPTSNSQQPTQNGTQPISNLEQIGLNKFTANFTQKSLAATQKIFFLSLGGGGSIFQKHLKLKRNELSVGGGGGGLRPNWECFPLHIFF